MGQDLPEPIGQQREVVYLKEQGHVVVLGTAGSGKTTMAVHRAIYLADEAADRHGPTLLVTFNRALVTFLKKGMGAESRYLTVENFHTFARGYLGHRGKLQNRQICESKQFIDRAVEQIRASHPGRAVLGRSSRFFEDELHWMAGHGIADLDTYTNPETRRIGRGQPLTPRDREIVYRVRDAYFKLRRDGGFLYDWDDLASAVRSELARDDSQRRYRHIVVDEGQDFTPEMIRALSAAIPTDGSLTFFADYAQQMYGSRMSWRSLGLNVRKPVEFQQNYRNSRQIARLAVAMSEMPHFRDDVDLVVPKAPLAEGPLPAIWRQTNPDSQLAAATALARELAENMRVAILLRTRDDESRIPELLGRPAIRLHKSLKSWPAGAGVFYGTYHAAKGLEFDAVILPWCDADILPHRKEVEAHGADEAAAREARLLYVAVTRAKTRLVLMHSGALTPLLPPETSDLYQRVSP